jgi:hypothetical protein
VISTETGHFYKIVFNTFTNTVNILQNLCCSIALVLYYLRINFPFVFLWCPVVIALYQMWINFRFVFFLLFFVSQVCTIFFTQLFIISTPVLVQCTYWEHNISNVVPESGPTRASSQTRELQNSSIFLSLNLKELLFIARIFVLSSG